MKKIEFIYKNTKIVKLIKPYIFRIKYINKYINIIVPAGFEWDGATQLGLGGLIGFHKFGCHDKATIVHDYLYSCKGDLGYLKLSRKFVDKLFARMLLRLGYKKWQVKIIYKCVRLGGFYYWREI